MSVPSVSPRTAVPNQAIVGTSEPVALPDMTDCTAARHFHLPARQVAATRRSLTRRQLSSERKRYRAVG